MRGNATRAPTSILALPLVSQVKRLLKYPGLGRGIRGNLRSSVLGNKTGGDGVANLEDADDERLDGIRELCDRPGDNCVSPSVCDEDVGDCGCRCRCRG